MRIAHERTRGPLPHAGSPPWRRALLVAGLAATWLSACGGAEGPSLSDAGDPGREPGGAGADLVELPECSTGSPCRNAGEPCVDSGQCHTRHCGNGFCCDAGECCHRPADCPPSFWVAAVCDSPERCQGHRLDATCNEFTCSTVRVSDDAACQPCTIKTGLVLRNGQIDTLQGPVAAGGYQIRSHGIERSDRQCQEGYCLQGGLTP